MHNIPHTIETREKLRVAGLKRRHTPESKIKMSRSKTGVKFSVGHKENISVAMRGESNPNWKGGVSSLDRKNYNRIYVSTRKRRVRELGGKLTAREWEEIRIQHGYKCAGCSLVKELTIDHIIPINKWEQWKSENPSVEYGCSDKENIQPLCQSCNSKKQDKIL